MLIKIIKFFHRKKMVYSKHCPPGQLYRAIDENGHKSILIIVTNVANSANTNPMYKVRKRDVIGIRIIPSPFEVFLLKLVGKTPSKEKKLRKLE